jgi:hypothetical protein
MRLRDFEKLRTYGLVAFPELDLTWQNQVVAEGTA